MVHFVYCTNIIGATNHDLSEKYNLVFGLFSARGPTMLRSCAVLVLILDLNALCNISWFQKRYVNDNVVNSSLVDKLEGRMWLKVPWSEVKVGDLVRVSSWPLEFFIMLLEVADKLTLCGILVTS